jgi:hypothetical protein
MSCADAAPDIIQAMTTIAEADLHMHAPLLLSDRQPCRAAVTRIAIE